MKLQSKILSLCLGCTLVALVLQTILFQGMASSLVYNHAKDERENSLQNTQNEIYGIVKNMESNLIEIYTQRDLLNDLRDGRSASELRKKYYREAYDLATGKFETGDNVVSLYLYTMDHEIISTYRKAVTPKHNYLEDIYQDVDYENAQKVIDYVESDNTTMMISSYYNTYREKNILRFVLKIYNNSNQKEKIGYIVCEVDSKSIESIMEKYCMDNTMLMWIQPMGDRPILTVGDYSEADSKYYITAVDKISKGQAVDVSKNFKQELFQAEAQKYNLCAYSLMPQTLLRQNEKRVTFSLILVACIMLISASVLSTHFSQSMTKPLKKLMQIMERIKNGENDLRTHFTGDDEIGQLGQQFDEMLDQMDELKEKEYQVRQLLDRAEYNALQAQINPHFLYNTLDTMSSIADIRGCAEVSRLCQSLSNIFRYTLNMKNQFSTVAKELMHLKNYVYVMSVRMQDSIHYEFNIDHSTQQNLLPRLSLQPLVENAINHGLKNKRGDKRIQINVEVVGDDLHICVADNGIGMDAGVMNERLKQNNISDVEQGDSIGLLNINARIKMLFGDAYGLYVESESGEGTRIHMLLQRRDVDGEQEKEI